MTKLPVVSQACMLFSSRLECSRYSHLQERNNYVDFLAKLGAFFSIAHGPSLTSSRPLGHPLCRLWELCFIECTLILLFCLLSFSSLA